MTRVECFNRYKRYITSKTNFFEKRVGEYSNVANPEMESKHEFNLDDDF